MLMNQKITKSGTTDAQSGTNETLNAAQWAAAGVWFSAMRR